MQGFRLYFITLLADWARMLSRLKYFDIIHAPLKAGRYYRDAVSARGFILFHASAEDYRFGSVSAVIRAL